MSNDCSIQNSNYVNGTQTGSVSSAQSASTGSIAIDGNTPGITDSYTNNSTQTVEKKTKRSLEELKQTVASYAKQLGINQEQALTLFTSISGYTQEELLDVNNEVIAKIIKSLDRAIEKVGNKDQEGYFEKLTKLAKNYNIALNTGWTIEGYENAQKGSKESLSERLERVYPGVDKMTALKRYFHSYFEENIEAKIANAKTPEEAEQIKRTEKKRQLQDFGRLLANSSDEDRALFKEAVLSLYAENKSPAFKSLLRSLEPAAQIEFADGCTAEYVEQIADGIDEFGDKSSANEVNEITHEIAAHQSLEGRNNFHAGFKEIEEAFFAENKEAITTIYNKIANGEELTDEEKVIYDKIQRYFNPVSSGEFTGTATNNNINEGDKLYLLQVINQDAYGFENYREVMEQIHEYLETHKDEISIENISNIINNATGGNYQTVVNDIKNGTTTNLTEPVVTDREDKNTTNNSVDLGFANTEKPVIEKRTEETENEETGASKPSVKLTDCIAAKKGNILAATEEYIEQTGDVSGSIQELLEHNRYGWLGKFFAKKIMKKINNASEAFNVLQNLDLEKFNFVANVLNDSIKIAVAEMNFTCVQKNETFDKYAEKINKKNKIAQ